MFKSRIPSPARSQGSVTPRRARNKTSRTRSVGSNASVRLSEVLQNENSFKLSPVPNRKSVLSDSTDVDEPKRKSWWKKLDENSHEVLHMLEEDHPNNPMELTEELEVETMSQNRNFSMDLPDSSDNESINSIVITQRKLFTEKNIVPPRKFGQVLMNRADMSTRRKTVDTDISIELGRKTLFGHSSKRKQPVFPEALLNISPNKTLDKAREINLEPKNQVRSLFGARQAKKRKNMFANFIASESEEELQEIQPKIFRFKKKTDKPSNMFSTEQNYEISDKDDNIENMQDDDIDALHYECDESADIKESPVLDEKVNKDLKDQEQDSPHIEYEINKSNKGVDKEYEQIELETNAQVINESNKKQMEINAEEINQSNKSIGVEKENSNNKGEDTEKIQAEMKKSTNKKNEEPEQIQVYEEKIGESDNELVEGEGEEVNKSNEDDDNILEKSVVEKERMDDLNDEKSLEIEADDEELNESNDEELNESNDGEIQKEEEEMNKSNKGEESDKIKADAQEINKLNKKQMEIDAEQINHSKENVEQIEMEKEKINESNNKEDMELERIQTNDEEMKNSNNKKEEESEQMQVDKETNHEFNNEQIQGKEEEINKLNEDDENVLEKSEVEEGMNDSNDEKYMEVEAEFKELNESNDDKDEEIQEKEKEINKSNKGEESDKIKADAQEINKSNKKQMEIDAEQINQSNENVEQIEMEKEKINESNNKKGVELEKIHTNYEEMKNSNNKKEEKPEKIQGEEEEITKSHAGDDNILEKSEVEEEVMNDSNDKKYMGVEADDEELNESDNEEPNESNDEEPNESNDEEPNESNDEEPEQIKEEEEINKSNKGELSKKQRMLPRESTGLSDGTKNSSAEGSGWDSHRTTRKTLRQTFGKDFTPRKSLRAMVMEKYAKRQSTLALGMLKDKIVSDSSKTAVRKTINVTLGEALNPQANSTEISMRTSLDNAEENLDQVANKTSQGSLNDSAREIVDNSIHESAGVDNKSTRASVGNNLSVKNNSTRECVDNTEASAANSTNLSEQAVKESFEESKVENDKNTNISNYQSEASAANSTEISEQAVKETFEESVEENYENTNISNYQSKASAANSNELSEQAVEETFEESEVENDENTNISNYQSEASAANYTELSEQAVQETFEESEVENDENTNISNYQSEPEVSMRTKQTMIKDFIEKIKQENLRRRQQIEDAVERSLQTPSVDIINLIAMKARSQPSFFSQAAVKNVKPKPKKRVKSAFIPLEPISEEIRKDMKYKPPKRFNPRDASWTNKRLYTYLEKKLEPKYDYKARVRAEKLVETIYNFTKEIKKLSVAPLYLVDGLKREMARLGIVETHHDFYQFFRDYIPMEIRVKVNPDIINEIPLPRQGIYSNILDESTRQR